MGLKSKDQPPARPLDEDLSSSPRKTFNPPSTEAVDEAIKLENWKPISAYNWVVGESTPAILVPGECARQCAPARDATGMWGRD